MTQLVTFVKSCCWLSTFFYNIEPYLTPNFLIRRDGSTEKVARYLAWLTRVPHSRGRHRLHEGDCDDNI